MNQPNKLTAQVCIQKRKNRYRFFSKKKHAIFTPQTNHDFVLKFKYQSLQIGNKISDLDEKRSDFEFKTKLDSSKLN